MTGAKNNTCIEEIWKECPSYTQYEVRSALAKCGLTTKHIESQVRVLSGGEQAKVRLCKLINRETNILLLDEPTQGVDVGARAEIYGHIRRATDAGSVAIVASSDTEELAAICDRVVVLCKGRRVAEVSGEDLTSEVLQRLSHTDGPAKEAA